MPVITDSTTNGISIGDVNQDDAELDAIGIELEYPTKNLGDHPTPVGLGRRSGNLQRQGVDRSGRWLNDVFGDGGGYMGSDHTGAEITSGILDLHSNDPEGWYEASIELAEEMGHPFAATGQGDTNFGLHMHVSTLADDKVEALNKMCEKEWARVFFCSSISPRSADPWRHGGVYDVGNSFSGPYDYGDPGHYEFRLPEPMLRDHFGLVMDWWRIVEKDGPAAAADYARELVYDKDDRLTPIQQYNQLREMDSEWPSPGVMTGSYTDEYVAEWFVDLME